VRDTTRITIDHYSPNRKSNTRFRLVPKSTTLVDLKWPWTAIMQGVWYSKSYNRLLIGNYTLAFNWCHFWWPWMIFEGHFTFPRLISRKLYRIRLCGRILYNFRDIGRGRVNDLQISLKVIKTATNRKLVYDFLLVVYSNFYRIAHRFWEIWCETVYWPWNIAKVIDIPIIWKQTFDILLAISISADVSYIISGILDVGG